MRELLDIKGKKKVAVIEKIFLSKNYTTTQDVLLRELNMTYPTLLSLVKTINEDAQNFGYPDFSIVHSSTNQLYSLSIYDESSVQLVMLSYIRNSPKCNLLELLLVSSFPNIQTVADKLYLPYVAARKDIKELNELLIKYNFSISTSNGIELKGDELGIRLYYAMLFLSIYGGEKWPFSFIQYFEITNLLKKCPKEIYNAVSLDKSTLVHFYVAVHLLRIRKNKYIEKSHYFDVPLYKPYPDESKESFEMFLKELKLYIPNVNEETVTATASAIMSVILAFGSYSSINEVPAFFYCDPVFRENKFLNMIEFINELIGQHLSIPLSKSEEKKLLYSLMSSSYRHLLFKNVRLDLESFIFGYTRIDRNSKKIHKMNHLKKIMNKFMDANELDILGPCRKELYSDYLMILDKRIDFSKHTLPIKVIVTSIISSEVSVSDFLNYFSPYYNLCVVDGLVKDIDLIISDFPLSSQSITALSINQPILYVNTRWTELDYEKVNMKLAEIATSKFVNKV